MITKPQLTGTWTSWKEIAPSIVEKNLEAVHNCLPLVWQEFSPLFQEDVLFLRHDENGFPEAGIRQTDGSIEAIVTKQPLSPSLSTHHDHLVILILGCDLGITLTQITAHLEQTPHKVAVIVEPDIHYFALLLAIHDFSAQLISNRFIWCIGNNWQSLLQEAVWDHNLFSADGMEAVPSATALFPERAQYWTVVKTNMESLRQTCPRDFNNLISDAITYYQNKPPGEIRRIMAPQMADGMALPKIQQRFLHECESMGMEIITVQPSFRADIGFLRSILQNKPDLLFFINRSPGEFAPITTLNQLRLPRMIWLVDDPECFVRDPFDEQDFLFTWDMEYEQTLRNKNARQIDYFPHAADMDAHAGQNREQYRSPVSFIGAVKALKPQELGLSPREEEFVRFIGLLKAAKQDASYQSLVFQHQDEYDLSILQSETDALPRFMKYGIYTVANAFWRIAVLEKVMHFGLKIYGNKDWLVWLRDHPLRSCYAGPADPLSQTPDIYASSTINLNIRSLQNQSGMNQRDFNCPLAGGFLLNDSFPGIEQFFIPNEEMVFYNNLDDLIGKVDYYLRHDDARREILRRGKERVQRDHTYSRRIPQIIDTLKKRIQERYGS